MTTTRKRLLFLHTGGTLGMTRRGPGPLEPGHYEQTVLPYVRGLERLAQIDGRVVCNLDSSDMCPALWDALVAEIARAIDDYDGFVVLHGTDTLAWTACALSFALAGLPRPVILTGSQRPIADLRTDARSNLVHSALCATLDLPEVGLYFGAHLFRGNRATKVSTQAYEAFASPNHPPLVTMGVDLQVNRDCVLAPRGPFRPSPGFASDVAVLSLVPGMDPAVLDHMVQGSLRAVVLRAFGEGNVPRAGWPDAIRRATDAGVTVAITTQCRQGAVRPGRYAGSAQARDAGAVYAGDMTLEATVVKTMWLLGQGASPAELRRKLTEPLAGELSVGDAPAARPPAGTGSLL